MDNSRKIFEQLIAVAHGKQQDLANQSAAKDKLIETQEWIISEMKLGKKVKSKKNDKQSQSS